MKKKLINKIKENLKEVGGLGLSIIFWSFVFWHIDNNLNEHGYVFWLIVSFFAIDLSWVLGLEKGKKIKKEPSDSEIIEKYGKILMNTAGIIYNPLYKPESLLPFPKDKIKDALERELILTKTLNSISVENSESQKYLFAIKHGISALSEFVDDDMALNENKKMQDILQKKFIN